MEVSSKNSFSILFKKLRVVCIEVLFAYEKERENDAGHLNSLEPFLIYEDVMDGIWSCNFFIDATAC